jgi:hypothetical protein
MLSTNAVVVPLSTRYMLLSARLAPLMFGCQPAYRNADATPPSALPSMRSPLPRNPCIRVLICRRQMRERGRQAHRPCC